MDLIDMMNSERWKYIYRLNNIKNDDYNVIVVVSEFTGGKLDYDQKQMSERNDLIVFIPMIVLNIKSIQDSDLMINLVKSDFSKYMLGKMPTTYNISKNVEAKLNGSSILLNFNVNGRKLSKVVDITEKEKIFFEGVDNLSLAINDGEENYVIRVALGEYKMPPIYPVKKMSLKQKNIERILDSVINNIASLEPVSLYNMNMYLDCNGSSDFEVYQSTEDDESLPSIRNLNLDDFCYSCGEKGVTREHCSPKWMTDKYKVKPLIGNILCKDCNNWFGLNYEKEAEKNLKIENCQMSDKQRIFISKWCIKTAVTMSIASGVNVCNDWLSMLKNDKLPENVKVYFDQRYSIGEKGFNYGISRFNFELSKKGTFLFSFICTDFLFVVMKTEKKIPLRFYKVFPKFSLDNVGIEFNNLFDLHKTIHELISGEETRDYSLPIRKQGERT